VDCEISAMVERRTGRSPVVTKTWPRSYGVWR
jgi:hypothetical protein